MIMRGGQQLLLPASPTFIWASLLTALLLDMLPFGRNPWMPDFMALVLVFWNVHQPLRIGRVGRQDGGQLPLRLARLGKVRQQQRIPGAGRARHGVAFAGGDRRQGQGRQHGVQK